MASRRPEPALKKICAGHYEGWGFSLSQNNNGTWDLIKVGSSFDKPIKFQLKSKAMKYVEEYLDKNFPQWRPKTRTRVLETHRKTVK